MKMAGLLALPKDAFKNATAARRMADRVSEAHPVFWVCVSYYVGAWIAKGLRFPDSNLSLIWPPTAILFAVLLLAPLRKWWIYLLSLIPVHIVVQVQDGVPGWGILSQLIGNFGQASLAAASVRYFNREVPVFHNFRSVVIFTLGAVIFAPVVVSSIVAYFYVMSGWEQNYLYAWRARVLSNALSTLLIAPPIILLLSRGLTRNALLFKLPQRSIEAGMLLVLLVLTSSVSFGKEVEELLGVACPIILPLPVLLWAALRFGLEGLCFSTLLVAYFAFASTAAGHGFFAMGSPAENVLSVQFYLIVTSLPLMWLAVLVQERQDRELAVRESEARYRALVTASSESVWRANAKGEGFLATSDWQQLTGQSEHEIREQGWLQAVHPDDRERARRLWERAMVEKCIYENEFRVRGRNGNYRYFYVHAVPILTPEGHVHEWVGANIDITERKQAEQALQDMVAGTAVIGEEFFPAYVRHVAAALDVYCASVAVVADEQKSKLRTLALWMGSGWVENYEYELARTPCDEVVREGRLFYCRDRLQEIFPDDKTLADLNAVSYMGVPLFNSAGRLIGSLCIIDNKPLADEQRARSVLGIFAARAAAEIERKRVEESLRRSEEDLKGALAEVERLRERLEAENVYLRREVSEAYRDRQIIGKSEGIEKVLRQVSQVAGTDMTVLVLGETGTGKELVARAVHERSGRRERPLVKVNCSALPGELIESELFGHEKGAFTGAVGRQVGRFELADGGTIFLDEVGDLPLGLQAKLLRVLQEGEFERLGSGKTIKVDVRVIAATNRNLVEGMQRGSFRPDLYYRLAVYPIGIPPLRERREDIGVLGEVFLREAGRRLGRVFDPLSEEVLEALGRYEWPGNVRELQNVIERAAVISPGRQLQLPEEWGCATVWKSAASLPWSAAPGAESYREENRPLEMGSLDEVGRNYIVQVLRQTGWRVEGPKGAAQILGLNPSTLRSRMLKLGIRRPFRSKAELQD
jgi:formate hydrogenlyase transcriptional activator